ncbi:MAG: DUF6703 family protein [Tetrasphaera sp.]
MPATPDHGPVDRFAPSQGYGTGALGLPDVSTPQPSSLNERLIAGLNRVPRAVPVLAVLALLAVGAFVPTFGWIATALVVLFLAWMLQVSWPRLAGVERLMRVAVIAFVAMIAIIQSRPRG